MKNRKSLPISLGEREKGRSSNYLTPQKNEAKCFFQYGRRKKEDTQKRTHNSTYKVDTECSSCKLYGAQLRMPQNARTTKNVFLLPSSCTITSFPHPTNNNLLHGIRNKRVVKMGGNPTTHSSLIQRPKHKKVSSWTLSAVPPTSDQY